MSKVKNIKGAPQLGRKNQIIAPGHPQEMRLHIKVYLSQDSGERAGLPDFMVEDLNRAMTQADLGQLRMKYEAMGRVDPVYQEDKAANLLHTFEWAVNLIQNYEQIVYHFFRHQLPLQVGGTLQVGDELAEILSFHYSYLESHHALGYGIKIRL